MVEVVGLIVTEEGKEAEDEGAVPDERPQITGAKELSTWAVTCGAVSARPSSL